MRVLTPERAEPTATPRIPRILPPSVQIASQTPRTWTPLAPRLLVPLPHASGGGGSITAGGEGAKDKPRGFAAEEPGGWMDSTMAWLGDKGDQCITVGQL